MNLTEESIKKILLYKNINELKNLNIKEYENIIEKLQKEIQELKKENLKFTKIIEEVNYKIFPVKKNRLGKYYRRLKRLQDKN